MGFELRSEAGILGGDDLTDEQKQAGDQVHALVAKMVNSDEKVDTPSHSFLPRIDKARHNRVLLIDGGRGSGKTALLLTLLDLWRRPFQNGAQTETAESLKPWEQPRGRIVPVGLLDLHPLPPSTNLLLHVVGRFERVVAWLEGDGKAEKEPAAWHFTGTGELPARTGWQKLLRAVAAGWDGNVAERSARLDLEAYTAELEEAERHRLDLTTAFVEFLDALAKAFRERRNLPEIELPLFVVAVDDADMNPRRSIELLDMLRMLWHPRLAFVLTGHSKLFLQTLAEYLLGELRRPLQKHAVLDFEIRSLAEGRGVMSLASEIYEKIIPPGHRCRLQDIPPARRLTYAQTKLEEVFKTIRAEPVNDARLPTLADYFKRTPQLREALPDRLRGLIDLADLAWVETEVHAADDATAHDDYHARHVPASRVVEAIWQHVVRSSREPMGEFEDMVRVDETTGSVEIRGGRRPMGMRVFDTRRIAQYRAEGPGPVVSILTIERLDAPLEDGHLLPRPVAAALMLAADVASDQTNGAWDMTPADHTGYEGIFASSLYQTATGMSSLRFAWPLPPGGSLVFYSAFSSRWSAKVRDPKKRKQEPWDADAKKVDEMARHFLLLVVYLWRESSTLWIEKEPPAWGKLAELVVNLMVRGAAAWRIWALRRAGLLAAPEYGLPADSANAWLRALTEKAGEEHWQGMREALRVERRERIDSAGGAKAEKLLAEIDAAFSEHAWGRDVEGMTAQATQVEAPPLVQKLFPVEPAKSPLHELKTNLAQIMDGMPTRGTVTAKIATLGDAKLHELMIAVAPYAIDRYDGVAPQALVKLWQVAAQVCEQPWFADMIVEQDGIIHIAPVTLSPMRPGLNPGTKHIIETAPGVRARLDLKSITAVVWNMDPPRLLSNGEQLAPALDGLYETIWDFALWQKASRNQELFFPSLWPGVSIASPHCSVEIRWPTYRWLEFARIERIIENWNEVVRDMAGGMFTSQQWVDALALWLLETISQDADNHPKNPRRRPNARSKDWAASVKRAVEMQPSDVSRRQAMIEWLYGAYLLAAPESGLSMGAAQTVLEELDREVSTTMGGGATWTRYEPLLGERAATFKSDRTPILSLRRQRLTDAGLSESEAEATLRAIDEDAKKLHHPWLKHFPPA